MKGYKMHKAENSRRIAVFLGVLLAGLMQAMIGYPQSTLAQESAPDRGELNPTKMMRLALSVDAINQDGNEIQASIKKLSQQGEQYGFDRIRLYGTVEQQLNRNHAKPIQLHITWHKMSLGTHLTLLDPAFNTDAKRKRPLKVNDRLSASGEEAALLSAWQSLKAMQEQGENEGKHHGQKDKDKMPEEQEQAQAGSKNASTGGSYGTGYSQVGNPSQLGLAYQPVDIPPSEVHDPVVTETTDGCNIRVDLAQNAAIIQRRVLVDGVEQSGCQDSLDRYPLKRERVGCDVVIQQDEQRVFLQYTVFYEHPESKAKVILSSCVRDESAPMVLITSAEQCSLYHDFNNKVSYAQEEQYYMLEGQKIVTQPCHINEKWIYPHQATVEACDPVWDEERQLYIPFEQVRIDRKGELVLIRDCAPVSEEMIEQIHTESCSEQPYEHDWAGKQSWPKIRYVLETGEKRVEISGCIRAKETLSHYTDESVCEAVSSDADRITQLYGKIYITPDGSNQPASTSRLYITDCEAVPAGRVAYVEHGSVWKKISERNEDMAPANGATQLLYKTDLPKKFPQFWSETIRGDVALICNSLNPPHCMQPGFGCSQFTGQHYCLTNQLSDPWQTRDGRVLDRSRSDQLPSWQVSANMAYEGTQFDAYIINNFACDEQHAIRYECSIPRCLVSTLYRHPIYLRHDGTEYIDTSQVLEEKYVCGKGSKVNEIREE